MGPGPVAMEMLAEAWSKIDPAGAFQRIQGWEYCGPWRCLSWCDRGHATTWLRRARQSRRSVPGALRDNVSDAVIHGWADSGDPAIWDAYVAGQPFGSKAAYDLMQRIAASEGVDALLRRAESVPEDAADGFRPLALRYAVDIAAETDPERAAAFAEQHRGWSKADSSGSSRVVGRLSDGPRATEWALSQPAGGVRDDGAASGIPRVAPLRRAGSDRLGGDASPMRSLAVLDLYASALGKSDPKRALEISVGIADPTERRPNQVLVGSELARPPAQDRGRPG